METLSPSPTRIGRCIACNEPERLNNDVCSACLERAPARWLDQVRRLRSDVHFAVKLLERASSERIEREFRRRFHDALPQNLNAQRRLHERWFRYGAVRDEWTMPPPPPARGEPEGR